jgi:hypothetical protein
MAFRVNSSQVRLNRPFNVQPRPIIPELPKDYNLLKNSITDWMVAILKTGAQNKVAPTRGSRFYFLASSILFDAYNVLQGNSFDMFSSLPKLHVRIIPTQRDVWIELCAYNGLKKLLESFNYSISELDLVKNSHITTYNELYGQMNNYTSNLTTWLNRVNDYINLRNNDKSNDTEPSSNFPNNGQYIEVTNGQDLSLLNVSNAWTPLHITAKGKNIYQSYLTSKWGDVTGIIDQSIINELKTDVINTFYPTEDFHLQETKEVLEVSQNLTPKEKITAEFWAGGPGTITPPGLWILFSVYCAYHYGIDTIAELSLYKRMTAGLFQASIVCWKVKREKMQERPIQAIRRLLDENVNNWTSNTDINTDVWQPYQEIDFVTPPFPDFVSGHSTFSGIGSRILTNFFKTSIIPSGKVNFDQNLMKLISPSFNIKCDGKCNISNILVYPETSFIQNNIPNVSDMPQTGVCLDWTTWDQMAEDAGKSRIYGGIHYDSSNQGGLSLGRNLAPYFYNI